MQLMEAIQLEEGYGKKKKKIELNWSPTSLPHPEIQIQYIHYTTCFLQQETAFMYPKLIISRSRCNLTMKLSETLSIKTQTVIYKANTFFVQRLSLKAYIVN